MRSRREELITIVRQTSVRTVAEWPDGPARLPNGADAAVCAHGALYLQWLVGGVLVGYAHDQNPTARLGEAEGGHDFLLVEGRYVVDLWGCDYDGRVPGGVLDLEDPVDKRLVAELYGKRGCWKVE